MKIVLAASECVPFASTGGLGDVASALPKALVGLGHECIRILPYYRATAQWADAQMKQAVALRKSQGKSKGGLKGKSLTKSSLKGEGVRDAFAIEKTDISLEIPIADEWLQAEVLLLAPKNAPKTYFVKFDGFYDRDGLYGPPGGEFHDNIWRYAFFQKAVVALLDELKFKADIVHCNDWQTGIIPSYLKHGIDGQGRTQTEKTVYTIHNLAYQGTFPGINFHILNLPNSEYTMEGVEFYDNINFMKAGILNADLVTTVSDTYAEEIQTEERGEGLHEILGFRKDDLIGIVNGVDYDTWNPETDPMIEANYDPTNLAGKASCKKALLKRMGLKHNKNIPVIGLVSRLASQKGIDLIGFCIEEIMDMGYQFVLLGSGDSRYERFVRGWCDAWPDQFAAEIGFSHELAHQIEAGSDLFLMPSVFEPCGLNQLYSLKYGTIPVVSNTGGLADTVQDFDGKKGTGFVMKTYDIAGLNDALQRAKDLWDDNPWGWKAMAKRGMKLDFSWDSTAEDYVKIYKNLLH